MKQIGDQCPVFELPDQNGNIISSKDLIGKKILVIYFYPKDHTPGCTKEACSFRDNHDQFIEEGCEVIGISSDKTDTHLRFADRHSLGFTLLSDTDQKVRKAFEVRPSLFGLIPGRVTYVIDTNGKIAGIYDSQTNPHGHVSQSLATVRSLKERS